MGTNALQNTVIVICKDDVTLCIQFDNEMIDKWLWTKSKHDDSLNTDLPDGFESFGSEVLSELHCESRRKGFFIRSLLSGMKSHTVLNQQITFVLWFGELDEVSGGIEIVNVGGPAIKVDNYLMPIRACMFSTMAATSSDVNLTLVLIFYVFSIIKDFLY